MSTRTSFRSLAPLVCAALVALPLVPAHATSADSLPAARPKLGLVLSGGGARGAAHIGVLRVLEREHVPIDYLAGTSMGALVGGLYAAGLSTAQLDSVVSQTNWPGLFADNIPRGNRSFRRKRDDDLYLIKHKPGLRGLTPVFPPGLLDCHAIDLMLKRLTLPVTGVRDFDRLGVPFRAVAADIVTGEAVVHDHGDLALALRTSMSIPAAFEPREVAGRLLVDGGIVDNVPIDVARGMGAERLIVVDIGTPPPTRAELYSVPAIAAQLASLAGDQNTKRLIASLSPADVFLRPNLGTITTASFGRAPEAVAIGQRAADTVATRFAPFAVPPAEYAAWQAARTARVVAAVPPRIAAVRIANQSRLADAVVTSRLHVVPGQPLDVATVERGLDQIYGLEQFELVNYDLLPGPLGDTLAVTARERAWGPNYVQGGVMVLDDFEHPNFNFSLAYDRTAIDPLNGEWRTAVQIGQEPGAWTELHQPLDSGLRFFTAAAVRGGERNLNLFDAQGHKRSEIVIRRYAGTLAAGRELGTWGEVRAGLVRDGGYSRLTVGDPGFRTGPFDAAEVFGAFALDKLDELAFPHHGASLRARYARGFAALGGNAEYDQLDAEGTAAATLGRYTGLVGALFGTTTQGTPPLEHAFALGGLGQLSGLEQDERLGPHALLVRAQLERRIASELLPVYIGLGGEYGNVFEQRSAIGFASCTSAGCVFLGLDTLLGPLTFAYGRADGGRDNAYFTLGQPLGGHRAGFRVD